jgi:hypothetical protein
MTPSPRSRTSRSETIMSTSDPTKVAHGSRADGFQTVLPNTIGSVPAGLPDPNVLARMANEFFTALPQFAPPDESAVSAIPKNAAVPGTNEALAAALANPSATNLPAASFPSEAQLRASPGGLPAAPTQPSFAAIPAFPLPEIPGGASVNDFSLSWKNSVHFFPTPPRPRCPSPRLQRRSRFPPRPS